MGRASGLHAELHKAAGRPVRKTPKGTIRCSVCGERKTVTGAVYLRRPGYCHRDPVCAGCKPAKAVRKGRGLVKATIPVSPLIQSAIDAHNAAVIEEAVRDA